MNSKKNSRNGSVLIVAILLGLAISIAIGTYLLVAGTTMKMANRSIHFNATMDIAEAGLDEALYTLNKYQPTAFDTPDPSAWTNWTLSGNEARRTFPKGYFTSSQQGTQGEFSVIVSNYTTQSPVIVVRARSWIANSGAIEKYIWATGGRRALMSGGLIAKNGISLNGNLTVNSYNSGDGSYGGSNINDGAFVASASITKVSVGNADIFGVVATGGSTPPQVNGQGYVGPYPGGKSYDPNNVSYGFQANFPPPPDFPTSGNDYDAPPLANLAAAVAAGLPTKYFEYDAVNGIYYLGKKADDPNILEAPAAFTFTSISQSTAKIVIRGPVRIQIAADFTMTGTAGLVLNAMPEAFNFDSTGTTPISLKVPTEPPLQVWVGGDFKLAGNGLTNPYTIPGSTQIYGTGGTDQDIEVHGNTYLSASIYAPNATVTVEGGGSDPNVYGGVVCNNLKMGSASVFFHCDEALANLKLGQFGVDLMRELKTPSERSAYTF